MAMISIHLFCDLAQTSHRVTVRLKTGAFSEEAFASKQKWPRRLNLNRFSGTASARLDSRRQDFRISVVNYSAMR